MVQGIKQCCDPTICLLVCLSVYPFVSVFCVGLFCLHFCDAASSKCNAWMLFTTQLLLLYIFSLCVWPKVSHRCIKMASLVCATHVYIPNSCQPHPDSSPNLQFTAFTQLNNIQNVYYIFLYFGK